MQWLDRFVSAGLDPKSADPDLILRVRGVCLGTLAVIVVFALAAAEGARASTPIMLVASVGGIVAGFVGLGIVRATHRYELAAHFVLAAVCLVIIITVTAAGGYHSTATGALYTLPIGAAVLINLRASVVWALIALATAVGFWLLAHLGIELQSAVPEGAHSFNALFNRVAILSMIVVMIAIFVITQRRTEHRIRVAHAELERQSAHVELLQGAAIAANESTTLREAIAKCLGRICGVKGWSLAHAFEISGGGFASGDARPVLFADAELDPDQQRLARESFRLLADTADPEIEELRDGASWANELAESPSPYRRVLAEQLGLEGRLASRLDIADRRWVVEFYSPTALVPESGFIDVLANMGTQLGRVLERERTRSQIRDLAYFDTLTGMPNRRHLRDSLESHLEHPYHSDTSTVLVHIGLDRFKIINDALGHSVGDALLCEVSDRIVEVVRTSGLAGTSESTLRNLVFRNGGDEFTVLLEGIREPAVVADLAQRLLDTLSEPCSITGDEVFARASMGISVSGVDGDEAQALLRCADTALATAKREGGNRFRFYSSTMNEANRRRLFIEHHLRRALARRELELHYQPLISAETGEVASAEALLRWTTAAGERISPAEFIPVAEATGQIELIGSWVLRTACSQLAAWRRLGHEAIRMSVNVSVEQLKDSSFVEMVTGVMAANRIPAGALELEITESRLIENESDINRTLERLRSAGVVLALDDFGTGYSSLSQLKRLPIDRLKIDRSFVSRIDTCVEDTALVDAVLQIARGLDLQVVAEGVESEAQAEILRGKGCDELQGYHFARPGSAEDLEKMLAAPTIRPRTGTLPFPMPRRTAANEPVPEIEPAKERSAPRPRQIFQFF